MTGQNDMTDNSVSEDELYEGGIIDGPTFKQILSMDDPGGHDFSGSIVYDFFTQAKTTFDEIDDALKKKDLPSLSHLGHFLKGSSVTLGLNKVRDRCEAIQQYGKHESLTGSAVPDDGLCLERITEALAAAKIDFDVAEKLLRRFFEPPEAEEKTAVEKETAEEKKTDEKQDAAADAPSPDVKAVSPKQVTVTSITPPTPTPTPKAGC